MRVRMWVRVRENVHVHVHVHVHVRVCVRGPALWEYVPTPFQYFQVSDTYVLHDLFTQVFILDFGKLKPC